MFSRFDTIPACYGQMDGRTDRRTDRIAISISRVSLLTRDKNGLNFLRLLSFAFNFTVHVSVDTRCAMNDSDSEVLKVSSMSCVC